MCGIAGVVRFGDRIMASDVAAVARMSEAQTHRGPDGAGSYHDSHVAFGHRRLSIIDVSEAGKQPMRNELGTIWVTYNGEIYNYRELRSELLSAGHSFASESDTEVLVHGYEEWAENGLVNIVGGCCGTAPLHIAAIAGAVRDCTPRVVPAARCGTLLAGLEPMLIAA